MTTTKHTPVITFVSQLEAEEMTPDRHTAMLSVTDPGEKAHLKTGWGAMLRESFIDGAYTRQEADRSGRHFAHCYGAYFMPEQAQRIRLYLEKILKEETITRLVVHCLHGKSRSSAIARFAADQYRYQLEKDASRFSEFIYYMLKNLEAPTESNALTPDLEHPPSLVATAN